MFGNDPTIRAAFGDRATGPDGREISWRSPTGIPVLLPEGSDPNLMLTSRAAFEEMPVVMIGRCRWFRTDVPEDVDEYARLCGLASNRYVQIRHCDRHLDTAPGVHPVFWIWVEWVEPYHVPPPRRDPVPSPAVLERLADAQRAPFEA